mmetsp:Transcript_6032/g.8498  ORF Transcript_6032/g.8498 Transcript_6032/m.8498 type:complete len:368 (-) Transcript_6032:128-1231(-)
MDKLIIPFSLGRRLGSLRLLVLSLSIAVCLVPRTALAARTRIQAGKIFKRVVRMDKVLDKHSLIFIWDCETPQITGTVNKNLETLRKRIRTFPHAKVTSDLGKRLDLDPSNCINAVLFPRWLSIDEAITQKLYQLRVGLSAADVQDWAWQTLSDKANAKIINRSGFNISVFWVHAVTKEPILQTTIAVDEDATMNSFVGHVFLIEAGGRNSTFAVTEESVVFTMGDAPEKDIFKELVQEPDNIIEEVEEKVQLKRTKKTGTDSHSGRRGYQELQELPDAKTFTKSKKKNMLGYSSKTHRLHVVIGIALFTATVVASILCIGYFYTKQWMTNLQSTKSSGSKYAAAASHIAKSVPVKSVKRMMKRNVD